MTGQMSIFDYMPTVQTEPEVGKWVDKHGAVISHVMLESYIGEKIVMDKSTASHQWFKVGILEKILPDFYYKMSETGEYTQVPCDRLIVYDGARQRNHIKLMPGIEVFECLPWDAYPERMAAIGRRQK